MSRIAIGILTAVILCLSASPALASHGGPHVGVGLDNINGQLPGGGGGSGGNGESGGGPSAGGSVGVQPVSNDEAEFTVGLGETPDGEQCWRVETGGNQTLQEAREQLGRFDGNGTLYDACPAGRRGPTLAERVQSAYESWRPRPATAHIDPGYAITGLRAFLEIDDPTPGSITLVGQTVTLSKEYRIRWGDGGQTTTTSTGVPYPGGPGEITHVYTDARDLVVEVDLVVSATWNGRNLGSLAPVTSSFPLSVGEVQATRRR